MASRFCILTAAGLWLSTLNSPFTHVFAQSPSPVIGVLAQPWFSSPSDTLYIAASYTKWLQVGGARSIPIPYDAPNSFIDEIFPQIHGILFPGVSGWQGSSKVPDVARYLWQRIVHTNANGDFFPVWGTCQGFEFLMKLAADDNGVLESGYDAENISLPLYDVVPYQLYKAKRLHRIVQNENITMNDHYLGISPSRFSEYNALTSLWKITSTSVDKQGRSFVSTIEPLDPHGFPVYGVQYHPEKNAFEYGTYPGTNIPYEAIHHGPSALELSFHTARFFVDLARKSRHSFQGKLTLVETYPIKHGIAFQQIYLIPPYYHQNQTAGSLTQSYRR